MFAHSMGNIVASEALRQAGTTKIVHTYVASQAASVAGAYDANAPKVLFSEGYLPGTNKHQPDFYAAFPNSDGTSGPYFGTINNAADAIYNFFNPNDYATNTGFFGPTGTYKTWRANQSTKPDGQNSSREIRVVNGQFAQGHLQYDGQQDSGVPNFIVDHVMDMSVLADRFEVFSYLAQAQTLATGAQPGLKGPFTGEVDLSAQPYGLTTAEWDHSAEFMSTYAVRQSYWRTLIQKMGV